LAEELFFDYGEGGFEEVGRVAAEHDLEGAGLDYAVHVAIEEGERFEAEGELDGLRLAGVEGDAAETTKFLDGPSDRTHFITNVELHNFVALALAGIGDIRGDFGFAGRADGGGGKVEISIFEGGVAEAPAKGKERLDATVKIAALGGGLLVVVIGELANRARNANGQFAAGIVVAKKNVGDSGAAFLAEIPAIENRGNIFLDVVDGVRATVKKQDDDGLARGDDGFCEVVLIAEEIEGVAIAEVRLGPGFAGSLFVFAEDKKDYIGFRATWTASWMRLTLSAESPRTTLSAYQSRGDSVILQPSEKRTSAEDPSLFFTPWRTLTLATWPSL
jgi:hypothetical protein